MTPLERSDRSGRPLEPDAPVTVTYLLDDGRRREVTVTAAEADELAQQGESRTTAWDRTRSTGRRWAKKGATAVVVALVGAFVGSEISDRYADRQRELEIEASLITQVSGGAIKLFQDAQEASRATDDPKQREQRDRAADAWVLLAGSITPLFRTYFGDDGVSARWEEYQARMYDWAVLGCCTSPERVEIVARIKNYAEKRIGPPNRDPPVPDPWAALEAEVPPTAVYQWVGFYLLRGRGRILDELKAARPELD